MDDQRYARARAVFFEALDLPAEERRAFVAKQCADDDALRADVEALLGHLDEDEAGDALEHGPGGRMRGAAEQAFDMPADAALAGSAGIPRRIAGHDVKGCLGEGGMGVVYEAEQRQPRRRVAIKLLRPGLVTREFIERFRVEADLLGRLRHPGIAGVFEAGQARPWGMSGPELPYLVMELVDGLPITTHAARQKLDVKARLELLAKTCDAIQHAHERGVVHRDLKPANVLVDETGQPRVLDFGVARALETDAPSKDARQDTQHVVGTLSYMAPEQFEEGASRSGPASDVYALGVLGYELLSGRLPLALAGLPLAEAMRRIRETEPPRLGTIDPRLAGDVESIVGKALAKEPERRYSSTAHFAADIRRHLGNEPILARPPRATYRARKFVQRHRALVASVAALVVVLVAGAVTSSLLAVRAIEARREADAAFAEARRATQRAQLAAAIAALREGDALTARAHLGAVPDELREWTWRHLDASLDDSLSMVATEVRDHARVLPTAKGLVVYGGDGISVIEMDGDQPRLVAHRAGRFSAVSSDGELAVESREGRWLLHSLRSLADRPTPIADPAGEAAASLARGAWALDVGNDVIVRAADGTSRGLGANVSRNWGTVIEASPDGEWLAVGGEHAFHVTRADSSRAKVATFPYPRVTAVQFSPDSRRVFVGGEGGVVHCVDLESGVECGLGSIDASRRRIVWLRVDAGGGTLLVVDRSGHASTWDTRTGAALGLSANTGYSSARAHFTPDGSVVLLPRVNGSIEQFTPAGRPAGATRIGHEATVLDVAWKGDRMIGVDRAGIVRVFLAPTSSHLPRLIGHESYVYAARFLHDGRIASISWDGTIRTWSSTTGALERTFPMSSSVGRTLEVVGRDRVAAILFEEAVLLDVATGEIVARVAGSAADLGHAAGRLALLRGDGAVEIRDESLGAVLARFETLSSRSADARRICLTTDGQRLAVSADSVLKELDAGTGAELWAAASMMGDILCLARSPDERLIAAGTRDGGVTIWDAATGVTLREIDVPGGATLGIAFHPSGAELVTGSHDGSVSTWDVERGELIARIGAHDDYVRDVSFSADGSMLVSASGDMTLRLFDTLRPNVRAMKRR